MLKTAEAVSLGHPDKTADYISCYILDRLIEQDKDVHYAVEVLLKDNTVVLGGEIQGKTDISKTIRLSGTCSVPAKKTNICPFLQDW